MSGSKSRECFVNVHENSHNIKTLIDYHSYFIKIYEFFMKTPCITTLYFWVTKAFYRAFVSNFGTCCRIINIFSHLIGDCTCFGKNFEMHSIAYKISDDSGPTKYRRKEDYRFSISLHGFYVPNLLAN